MKKYILGITVLSTRNFPERNEKKKKKKMVHWFRTTRRFHLLVQNVVVICNREKTVSSSKTGTLVAHAGGSGVPSSTCSLFLESWTALYILLFLLQNISFQSIFSFTLRGVEIEVPKSIIHVWCQLIKLCYFDKSSEFNSLNNFTQYSPSVKC